VREQLPDLEQHEVDGEHQGSAGRHRLRLELYGCDWYPIG
jgi:hypothetical protein